MGKGRDQENLHREKKEEGEGAASDLILTLHLETYDKK